MHDLLDRIATREDEIVDQWARAIRALPDSPYAQLDDSALKATIRRSARALLHLMRTGETADLRRALEASARKRAAQGGQVTEAVAVWLVYRQIVQHTLQDTLTSRDHWDQFIDRVDAALAWVVDVLREAYQPGPASRTGPL
ncbi:MAG: hypothetical protein Kow0077_32510 [Anaerolineae bacterium]